MNKQSATVYLREVAHEWGRCLGDAVTAIVGYGSVYEPHFNANESDLNLLILLADNCDIEATRTETIALWDKHQACLKRSPRMVLESVWAKHLMLNPVLLEHFRHTGRLLYGGVRQQDIQLRISMSRKLYWWREAFLCSQALFQVEKRDDLMRLWRQVKKTAEPMPGELVARLGEIWHAFDFPTPPHLQAAPQEVAPYGIQNLIALYSSIDVLVVILGGVEDLLATDWAAVEEQMREQGYNSARVATPIQFYSMLSSYDTLDVQLLTYDYVWGIDIVAEIKPKIANSCYAAARFASDLQVNYFADCYFPHAMSPEHSSHHIHELQNKLLNIRLQNEILTRFALIDPFVAESGALPDREVADSLRIRAIYERLGEWVDYYIDVAHKYGE